MILDIRRMWVGLLVTVLGAVGAYAQDEPVDAPAEKPAEKVAAANLSPVLLNLKIQLDGQAALKAADVKFAVFPSGRRCCFTYNGPRSPKTIEVLSKLGFRTTLYCSPNSSGEQIKALEDAGADVGVSPWGQKGNYSSNLGQCSIQEAFDACATSRVVLRKNARSSLGATDIGGHYGPYTYLIDRNPDKGDGFGYAYHDSNYLIFSDNKPYPVILGRQRDKLMITRENFDNTMRTENVPNEVIYYQILANQFRGTLKREIKGQIVRFTLRDFKAPDLADLTEIIGQYGNHEQIWHASESMIGSNEYIRQKAKVQEVKVEGDVATVTLAIERDTFMPFVITPLPVLLPKTVKVKSASLEGVTCPNFSSEDGPVVDVPLQTILRGPLSFTLAQAAPDMTVPDEMPVTLTVKNNSDKPVSIKSLEWIGSIAFEVKGGEAAFEVPAKGETVVKATAKSSKGARFGITPVEVLLTDSSGKQYLDAGEVVVAPRLRAEMDPMQSIPLAKGRWQYFFVHLSNIRGMTPAGPTKFISHKASACKGVVSWDLPAGMKSEPPELPFELAADDNKTLIFKLVNDQYSAEKGEMVKPLIRFEGEKEPVNVLFPGTVVIRDESRVAPKALDDTGLTFLATWDDPEKGGKADKSVGNPSPHFYPGHIAAYNNEGVKGWCMNSRQVCEILDSWKNIDYWEGTVCFWVRKDPFVRNENTYVPDPAQTIKFSTGRNNSGESLFLAGDVQNAGSSNSGIAVRRFRSWQGKPGYLQLTYRMMGNKVIALQYTPFEWTEEWRHVAFVWSVKDRKLELFVDGKSAGKADPGEGPWMPSPWDRGRWSGWNMQVITSDHGNWTATCRDEVYIYNRVLSPEQIKANMDAAKQKPAKVADKPAESPKP